MAFLPKFKKMIDDALDREIQAGYDPVHMILPTKLGCRVCSTKEKGRNYTVTVVGKRVEERKVYLWAIATLCGKCLKKETGEKSEVVKLMMHRWSEGVIR